MKKVILCIFLLSCLVGLSNTSFANYNISAISNKEYSIIYNDEIKGFYNADGVTVYPILYEGTNYLPIRAVSSLFNVAIEWNGEKNIIYLGNGQIDNGASKTIDNFKNEKNQNIDAIVNEEINIIYNGEVQKFYKTVSDSKKRVFPIFFEGTTYLPIRNITELFDGIIEWDGTNKIIKIDSKDYLMQKNKTDENLYYVGDEYTYSNGDVYFRMYEPSDYKTDYTGQIYHEYNTISGERNIARIRNSVGATNVEILFKNDSRGSFSLAMTMKFTFRI